MSGILCSGSTAFSAGAASSLLTGLAAYYVLDTTSWLDSTGGTALTGNNSPTIVSGHASFVAASSQYLSLPDNAATSIGDIDCTFFCWVQFDTVPSAGNYPGFICKGDAGNREWYLGFQGDAGVFQFQVDTDGAFGGLASANSTFGTPTTGTPYFVLGEYDKTAGKIRISINNGTSDENAHTGGIFDGTNPLEIGRGFKNYYLNGKVWGAGIVKRLLTPTEKATLAGGATYPF